MLRENTHMSRFQLVDLKISAEAVNPFPKNSMKSHTITKDELEKGTQSAKRDLSRRNEVF